jgi:hypothetical protein
MNFTQAQDWVAEIDAEIGRVAPAARRHAELQALREDIQREAGIAPGSTTDRYGDLVVKYRHNRDIEARERALCNEALGDKK